MESLLHSVSLADFDLHKGNTISQTYPASVDLAAEVRQSNLHDLCFPDGAHEAQCDTVYGVLDRIDGGQLYAVGFYRAVRTNLVKRGAVQRGILVLSREPLYRCLSGFVHKLLDWWIVLRRGLHSVSPVRMMPEGGSLTASIQTTPECPECPPPPVQSPASFNDAGEASKGWTEVVSEEIQLRNASPEVDAAFLQAIYDSLVGALSSPVELRTHLQCEVSFSANSWLKDSPAWDVEFNCTERLDAPRVSDGIGSVLGHGCDLRWLLSTFRLGVGTIYNALLSRETICFVGHGHAQGVGRAVLSCANLTGPLWLEATELAPYFTVSDASKIEKLPFCVCGSTNPFYEDTARNKWASLICHVHSGTVTPTKGGSEKEKSQSPTKTGEVRSHKMRRLLQHITQGVQDGRPEAWVRAFFQWHTARTVRDAVAGAPWSESSRLPPLVASSGFEERAGAHADSMESLLTLYTKCHEVNAAKMAVHVNWFATMLESFLPTAERSEDQQRALYAELKGFSWAEAATLEDVTTWACSSKTEEALLTQMWYEEEKVRRLLRRLQERVFLLIDAFNSGNERALRSDENRIFADTFNLPQFLLYNVPQQVILHTSSCSLALQVFDGLEEVEPLRTTGRLWITRNYFAFKAGWLSRRKAKDKSHTVEIFPFDIVRSVLRTPPDCSIMSDGLRVSLPGVMLYVGGLNNAFRTAALLQTLVEKQRGVQARVSQIDPVIAVQDQVIDMEDPLAVTRRVVIPSGLYLHERHVREEVWELQRYFPIVGWSKKLLPTDPPDFCDWSGQNQRRFDSVVLPPGWKWEGEWAAAGIPDSGGAAGSWEFSSDFKMGGWKEEKKKGKLDLCRRRCWVRVRELEKDSAGCVLPPPPPRTDGLRLSHEACARKAAREAVLDAEEAKLRAEQTKLRSALDPRHRDRLVVIRDRLEEIARLKLPQSSTQSPPEGVASLVPASTPVGGAVSIAEFHPRALLAEAPHSLSPDDFKAPDGDLNPFHSSSVYPGCGSSEVACNLGCRAQLLNAEDELIAETLGLLPKRSRGLSLSPARFMEGLGELRDQWRDVRADFKQSFAGGNKSAAASIAASALGGVGASGDNLGDPALGGRRASMSPSPVGSPAAREKQRHRWRSPPRSRGVVLLSEQDKQKAREDKDRRSPQNSPRCMELGKPPVMGDESPRQPRVQFIDPGAAEERSGTGGGSEEPGDGGPKAPGEAEGGRKTPPPDGAEFSVGTDVEVHSLQRLPEMNGQRGTVVAHQRRWDGAVVIVVNMPGGQQQALRPKNLRLIGQ
eukprot:Hpha_TRINITY_DN15087_c1_g3::TRINITY_DN15087_c1_g3_i1::g.124009::m.124009